MAARGYEFYLRVVKDTFSTKFLRKTQLFLIHFRNSKIVQLKWSPSRENLPVTKIWQLFEKVTGNFTVFAPRSHFVNEISKEPAARLSGKLSCNWLIMLVTMATPMSSHVKDKNNIFTARDEDMIF